MAIAIVTDSTANIPAGLIEKYDIKIVPLNIQIKDKVYREGIDISCQDYYELLRREPVFPKTSQPSAGDFLNVFESYPGDCEILVITISSNLSGTLQSAATAASMAQASQRIALVDSESTTIGQGFLIAQAGKMMEKGSSLDDIEVELERIKQNNRLFFIVDNLEHLARGGRISQISKYIGTILRMKPILHLHQGRIELFDKVRTSSRAINRILGEMKKDLNKIQQLAILHVSASSEAHQLKLMVEEIYQQEIEIYEATPVIGTHVGPGTIGLAYHM
ncbi:MAG: DegV family protein [Syntrophomonas sp.]